MKKNDKKIISIAIIVFAILIVLSSLIPLTTIKASAAGNNEDEMTLDYYPENYPLETEQEFFKRMTYTIENNKVSFKVDDLNLDNTCFIELISAYKFSDPIHTFPLDYISYVSQNDKIVEIYPKLFEQYKPESIKTYQYDLNREVNKIVEKINKDWTDFQKAFYVYLYISNTYIYAENQPDMYEMVRTTRGNCMAYSMLYKTIMTKLGVPCECVVSVQIEHAWNLVKINGFWYNVDTTWAQKRDFSFFLLSDEANALLHNIDLTKSDSVFQKYHCDDKTYDDCELKNEICAPAINALRNGLVFSENGYLYTLKKDVFGYNVYKANLEKLESECVMTINAYKSNDPWTIFASKNNILFIICGPDLYELNMNTNKSNLVCSNNNLKVAYKIKFENDKIKIFDMTNTELDVIEYRGNEDVIEWTWKNEDGEVLLQKNSIGNYEPEFDTILPAKETNSKEHYVFSNWARKAGNEYQAEYILINEHADDNIVEKVSELATPVFVKNSILNPQNSDVNQSKKMSLMIIFVISLVILLIGISLMVKTLKNRNKTE